MDESIEKAALDQKMEKWGLRFIDGIKFLDSNKRKVLEEIYGEVIKKNNRIPIAYVLLFAEPAHSNPLEASEEEPFNSVLFPYSANTVLKYAHSSLQKHLVKAMNDWAKEEFGEKNLLDENPYAVIGRA